MLIDSDVKFKYYLGRSILKTSTYKNEGIKKARESIKKNINGWRNLNKRKRQRKRELIKIIDC